MRDRRQRAEKLIRGQQERAPLLFIGGLAVESEGNATIPIINPASGQPIGRSPAANVRDVEHAVEAARHAAEDWAQLPSAQRAQIMLQCADLLEQHADDLAILEAMQTGKTFREVLNVDVGGAIAQLRYYAGYIGKRPGETHDLGSGLLGVTVWEPHPVTAVITSWASPFGTTLKKVAPALAAGSAVVVKPAEQAPLTVLRAAELMTQAGLPPGVLNVVTGFGGQTGEALAMSPHVSMLAFQGSIETARRVLVSSAKSNLKKVAYDLGGKGAHIIFQDADVRAAVGAAWKAIFSSRSREPFAGSRVIVHDSLYEMLATTLAARAKEIVLGDPLDEHTELGPMITEEHMKKVLAYTELGRREGAKLVAGGKRDVEGTRSDGFFVQPTVFVDVLQTMRIAREEIGGPLLSIIPFKSEDQAVEIANDTEYGLAGAVWTQDISRAHRIAKRVRAGCVWINDYGRFDPAMPFGGFDLSGYGRDGGRVGIDQYSRTKSMYLPCR